MSENEQQEQQQIETEEFPVDPVVDAMYAVAEQFFTDVRASAESHKAEQEALDYIDQMKERMVRFRKEDPMLTNLLEEGREEIAAVPVEDPETAGMELLLVDWIEELRDRRRGEAHGIARQAGGGCQGCEGCG